MSRKQEFTLTTRTVEVRGLELPVPEDFRAQRPDAPATVFVDLDTLYALAEQDVFESQFGSALLLGRFEGIALEAAGLAVRETRGGYHRSKRLEQVMADLGLL
ncbi:hypothetical protein [Nocardioides pakistanensis]